MASKPATEGPFVSWYQNRIGDPSTGDEARGYWVFARCWVQSGCCCS